MLGSRPDSYFLKDPITETRPFGSFKVHVVNEVVPDHPKDERRHLIAHSGYLNERFDGGKLHDPSQIELAGKDEDERVIGNSSRSLQGARDSRRDSSEGGGLIDHAEVLPPTFIKNT
jgi:hypothetical protein